MQKTPLYSLFPHFLRNSSESIRTRLFVFFFVQIAPIIELQTPNCGKIAENTLFFPISSHLFIDKLFVGATDTSPVTERERYKKKSIEILKALFKKHPQFPIGQIISEYKKIKDAPFYADKYLRDIIRKLGLDKRTHKPRGPDKKARRITCLSTAKRVTNKK